MHRAMHLVNGHFTQWDGQFYQGYCACQLYLVNSKWSEAEHFEEGNTLLAVSNNLFKPCFYVLVNGSEICCRYSGCYKVVRPNK